MHPADSPSRREFLGALGVASAVRLAAPLHANATRRAAARPRGLAAPDDFLFDADLAYLQTGSLGPTPRPVMDRTIAAWREMERNPVLMAYGADEHAMDAVRANAAAFLNCTTDEIVLTTCTTDGMNRTAQGLGLSAGDHVLTTDQEHPGGRVCWDYLARTRGVMIDTVPIVPGEHDAPAIVDRMARAITPRTRVLSFSHLLSSTGMRLPVAELCAAARAHDCVSVVDGAQAAGGIAVDVRALGCDVYATSGHKWLLAPKGTGLLYLRAGLGNRVDPIGLQSGRAAYTASTGVGNIPGVIGLGSALDYLRARGVAAIEAHNLALRERLDTALSGVAGLEIVSAREPALASPLLSYRLPARVKALDLHNRLLSAHRVVVKVVPENWFNGQRISTHLFNTEDDVDRLVAALRRELS
jgi:selenocysteine lyase/cysteine desulfurase